MKKISIMIIFIFVSAFLAAGQRDKGEIVLQSLSVKDGKLSFETETGGCTTKQSFRINIEKGRSGDLKVTNYILTITREIPDQCKGFFTEGIVVEYELEKDLGLKGDYTVTVKNMVLPRKE